MILDQKLFNMNLEGDILPSLKDVGPSSFQETLVKYKAQETIESHKSFFSILILEKLAIKRDHYTSPK